MYLENKKVQLKQNHVYHYQLHHLMTIAEAQEIDLAIYKFSNRAMASSSGHGVYK